MAGANYAALKRWCSGAEFALCVLLFGGIVVLVFLASLARFVGHPLIWSVDFAQLLFIWLCFLGAARALRHRAHIGVDLLVRYLPRRWQFWLEVALAALTLVFLAMLAVEGVKLTLLNRERVFGDSGISYAFVTIAVPVGCVLLSLSLVSNLVEALLRRRAAGPGIFAKTDDELAP